MPYADAVELVRERFLQSIRFHLRSDVPLGAALSGGVDSSAVVCAMRHVDPGLDIHTFSYVAHGSPDNEEHWVDLVNAHVNARGHKVVISEAELARDIDAGQVYINEYFAGGIEVPFGGNKQSGFGREKGIEGLKSYCKVKSIAARIG